MNGTATPGTESLDTALGGLLAAGLLSVIVYFVLAAICLFLSYYVFYLIIKAAVRNGAIEAIRWTGLDAVRTGPSAPDRAASGAGAPPAPVYRAYRV